MIYCVIYVHEHIVYFVVDTGEKEIYRHFYSQLVSSLPMKDPIFLSKLVTLLPDNLKERVESQSTAADAATFFLDNMIKPAVEFGNSEAFYNLLTIMERSDNVNVKNLAQSIRKEIQNKLGNGPVTGKTMDNTHAY